jgi:hypothetical protein
MKTVGFGQRLDGQWVNKHQIVLTFQRAQFVWEPASAIQCRNRVNRMQESSERHWAIEILLGRQQKRPVVTAIPARRMQKDQLPAEHTIPLCGNEHRASERPPCSHKEFVVVYLFRDLAEQESLRRHRPCVSETSSSAPPIEAQLIPSACMRPCDRSCGAL